MNNFKRIFLIFLCFLCIFSILNIHTSAIAVEVIGGSYAAYVILAAALAAAGYTVATSSVSSEIFQGILDSPNAELVKALIGSTTMFATAKGQLYFNWSSSQWSVFTDWVTSYLSSGILNIPAPTVTSSFVPSSEFNSSLISSYPEKVPTRTGIVGTFIGNTALNVINGNLQARLLMSNENSIYFNAVNNWYFGFPSQADHLLISPFVITDLNTLPKLYLSVPAKSGNATSLSNATSALNLVTTQFPQLYINNVMYQYVLRNGQICLTRNNTYTAITGTALFPNTYTSVVEWFEDVINTGNLVGDLTGLGIGEDVINPGREIEVPIDSYPDYQVGEGTLSIPDVIGGSIDVPLDRWIDVPIDVGQDPVSIDFTDWPDKTIETTPDDVVPDVRLNPPLDIPQNPDVPWADTESYPIDYPIDTDTPYLPDTPNPNPDPEGDNSNRMKLGPLILSKFPFCLPWDLQHSLKSLVAPAEAPVFDVPFKSLNAGVNENIHLDLSRFNIVASVSRWFFSALWVVILILLTRKIVWK